MFSDPAIRVAMLGRVPFDSELGLGFSIALILKLRFGYLERGLPRGGAETGAEGFRCAFCLMSDWAKSSSIV